MSSYKCQRMHAHTLRLHITTLACTETQQDKSITLTRQHLPFDMPLTGVVRPVTSAARARALAAIIQGDLYITPGRLPLLLPQEKRPCMYPSSLACNRSRRIHACRRGRDVGYAQAGSLHARTPSHVSGTHNKNVQIPCLNSVCFVKASTCGIAS